MPKLKELKERLEKLPQLKNERALSGNFAVYTQKVLEARGKLTNAFRDMEFISKVYPDIELRRVIVPLLKESARKAKKLHQSIKEDPQIVKRKSTENSVIKIDDNAKSAKVKCRDIWNREISKNADKWEKLAVVIQGLGAKGGQEFKQAVESIKNQTIPQDDDEANSIINAKEELQKGIANLGLEGPFGKFLEISAEKGASTRDLFRPEIKEKLDEFNLWDSFKVRLR